MKTISRLLKRIGMVTHVIGIESIDEITVHDRHHYYFNVNEDTAIKLFKDFDNVVCSLTPDDAEISDKWAGLTLAKLKSKKELRKALESVSSNEGVIVYRYDNFFNDENELELTSHITTLKNHNFLLLCVLEDSEGKYIIAKTADADFLELVSVKQLRKFFVKPLVNTDFIKDDEVLLKTFGIKQKRRLAGLHPSRFSEKKIPEWKGNYFKNQITLASVFLETSAKEKFKKRPIKMPNKEQAMILLANGNFEKEFTLKDGSLMSFKSTEFITSTKKLKFNDVSEVVAEREIQVRSAAVLGLNYTNGTIITFS